LLWQIDVFMRGDACSNLNERIIRILDTRKRERCLMADSVQNEPENDKKDKNELSGWNLADYLVGETAARRHDAFPTEHDASPSEKEVGSLFEPSGEKQTQSTYPVYTEPSSQPETSAAPQEAVHADTSSLFEPGAEKQTHSTYPVHTEPSSQPETSSLLEPSAETEIHPQEAVHAKTNSPFELSGEKQTQPTYPVYTEPSSLPVTSSLPEPSAAPQEAVHAETSSPFGLSGEKQTHSTYSVHTETSSLPETSSLLEPSVETEIHPQEAVHAETSSPFELSVEKQTPSTYPVYTEPSSLPVTSSPFELSAEKQTQSTYPVYTEPTSLPETSSLPEPSAAPQEAVHAETSSPFEPSGEKQTPSTYPVYTEPSSQLETSSLPETSAAPQEAVHAETSSPFELSGEKQTPSAYPVYTEPSSQPETSPLPETSAKIEIRPQDAVHAEANTPSYMSREAETREQNPAGTEAETGRHDEPAEKTAAYEARPKAAEPDMEKAELPIVNPELIPPVEPAEPEKPRPNVAFLFAAAVLAILIVIVGVFVAIYWQQINSTPTADSTQAAQPAAPTIARDLGTVDSSAAGFKGHLTTKWDQGLGYSFVIEPDDPARRAAFAMTVSNPPRAASVAIQIKDADGVVLCSHDVLLRFDPRKVAAINEAAEKLAGRPPGVKGAAAIREEQEAELDRQVAAEADREHGKSIFQVNAGQNGKIQSISSQGEIPCPQSVYEGMGYWSFLPDFPSPGEQAAWLDKQLQVQATVETTAASASEANKREASTPAPQPAAHKRMTYKAAVLPGTFSIAGDDAIVEYDVSAGNIGTKAGKVFSIDKAGAEAHAIQGYDLPVTIHYRCDQYAACTITHGGVVIARAKLSQ
jgi:hypothetical protein